MASTLTAQAETLLANIRESFPGGRLPDDERIQLISALAAENTRLQAVIDEVDDAANGLDYGRDETRLEAIRDAVKDQS